MQKLPLEYQMVTKAYLKHAYLPAYATLVTCVTRVTVVTVETVVTVLTVVTIVTEVTKKLFFSTKTKKN